VLIASVVVFVIDLIGNSITFSNRYLSALASAIVFGALVYFGYDDVSMSASTTQNTTAPVSQR
jgi:hypothetical protein